MNIAELCNVELNDEQLIAAKKIQDFLDNTNQDTFLLKGHAGTGKTTLLQGVIDYLENQDTYFVLLASTGRAAKILGEKTMHNVSTVHRHIYQFELDEMDDDKEIRKLIFRLKNSNFSDNIIFIVDESSMLSDHKTSGGFVKFGTGRLISDFFKYTKNCKVIFSGDPSQLPPVNLQFSPALMSEYLINQHDRNVTEVSLKTSMRYEYNSGIGYNTEILRNNVINNYEGYLQIRASSFNDINIHYILEDMTSCFADDVKEKGIDNVIFITFSNKQASILNQMIRQKLFRNYNTINKGEILMVFANNYLHDVANGEHLVITNVGRKELRGGITFLEIEAYVREPQSYRTIKGFLIEDMLKDENPSLGSEKEHALFKDFAIRMKNAGISPKEKPDIYMSKLLNDPYLNAIRAKYGYAVTCHKAQGGEWESVYLMIEKAMFHPAIKPQIFRWSYTAISRAIKQINILDNYAVK